MKKKEERENRDFLANLGKKLKKCRIEKGWTLEKCEEEGYPSWQRLQKLESGANMTVLTLKKLAKIYKVPISKFFEN